MNKVTVDLYEYDNLRKDRKLLKEIKKTLEGIEVKYNSFQKNDIYGIHNVSRPYLEMNEYKMMDKLIEIKGILKW